MSETDGLACVEYYRDGLQGELLAAIDMPRKKLDIWAQRMGSEICKLNNLNSVEALALDPAGDMISHTTVYRK